MSDGACTFFVKPDEPVKGRMGSTGPVLSVGDVSLNLTPSQLREVVECGINLLSDLNLGRLPGCDGSDLPAADRAA